METCIGRFFFFIWTHGQENENNTLEICVTFLSLWLSTKFEQCLVLNSNGYFGCIYPQTL